MFYGAKINDECFYFIKTLSENKKLATFIDEVNSQPSSYSMISAWEDLGDILKKSTYKNSRSENVRVYQKCLYIINSLDSGIRFCLGLFCENSKFNSFEIKDIDVYRIDSPTGKNIIDKLDKTDNSLYCAYMFINNDPGKLAVTFNDTGQVFTLDEASIIVVSNKENIKIEYFSQSPLYFAKASILLT
jgi:hypothetical protein